MSQAEIALSPAMVHLLRKWLQESNIKTRFLSGFSLEEANECRALIFPTAAERAVNAPLLNEVMRVEVNNHQITERYLQYGGIARNHQHLLSSLPFLS
jgi:hypothetical protein